MRAAIAWSHSSICFFQQLEELPVLAQAERIGVMVGAVGFHGAGVDELAAALGHGGQLPLLGRKPGRWLGFEVGAIVREDGGIDGIGFGALALGTGEVTDTAGFDNADGEVSGLEDLDHRLFIAAVARKQRALRVVRSSLRSWA